MSATVLSRLVGPGGELVAMARRGGRAVAGLVADKSADGLEILAIHGAAAQEPRLLSSLARTLAAVDPRVVFLPAVDGPGPDTLRRAGFTPDAPRVLLRRPLVALPSAPQLRATPLASVGWTEAAALLGCALQDSADPTMSARSPLAWLSCWRRRQIRFSPSWALLSDAAGPVGLCLPGLNPDGSGSLWFIGVLPDRRRQGHGAGLHTWGLRALAHAGATTYRDCVAPDNGAMRAVLARNGCVEDGSARLWALR